MAKYHPFIAIICLAFTPTLWAKANAFDTTVNSEGVECGFYLDHYPSIRWSGIEAPPLTVEEASKVFNQWAKNKYGHKITSHVLSYKLWSVIPKTHKSRSWVYKITYANLENNAPPNLLNRHVVITMGKKVIESTCDAL